MVPNKILFFILPFPSYFSSSPSTSQALRAVVDLGFQNSLRPFQRVSVHHTPVLIPHYIYARVIILGMLRVVN